MSYVKIIDINCQPAIGFAFISDPTNWPIAELNSITNISRDDFGLWNVNTKAGPGSLRLTSNPQYGLIDYMIFLGKNLIYSFYLRIIPKKVGFSLVITGLTNRPGNFCENSDGVISEIGRLKHILEKSSSHLSGQRSNMVKLIHQEKVANY